jgi:uncharacterized membrane protein YphA (DoxX/SURF4 family)
MKKVTDRLPTAARILLGLVFVVFGLNGFLQFIPMPEPPPAAGAFFGALAATGYFLPLLKATEVAVGVLLLAGRWVPLALTVLAPITVQIFAFHAFLEPGGMPMTVVILALHVFLAWCYRSSYRALFVAKASTTRSERPLEARLEQNEAMG